MLSQIPDISELLPTDGIGIPLVPMGLRPFTVYRRSDESGVSGTGIIIQGVLFANGKCAIQWVCEPVPGNTVIHDWDEFLKIHVKSHKGNGTIITFGRIIGECTEQLVFGPDGEIDDTPHSTTYLGDVRSGDSGT